MPLSKEDFLSGHITSKPLSAADFGIGTGNVMTVTPSGVEGEEPSLAELMYKADGLVPMGVKDTPYRRQTITQGNFTNFTIPRDTAILSTVGVEPETPDQPHSLLQKMFKALDFPGSKVRELMSGMPAEEGNNWAKILEQNLLPKLGVDILDYEEPQDLKAKIYKKLLQNSMEKQYNPMAIDPNIPDVIPGTNVKRSFVDQFKRMMSDVTNPAWHQEKAIQSTGLAMDILTDPIATLGPGILAKESATGSRTLLSLRTPEAMGMKSHFIDLTPKFINTRVNSTLADVGNTIAKTRVGQVIGKALMPGFGLPKDYYNMHQDQLDKINYNVQKLYELADQKFKHLSDDELKAVSHFVEGNTAPLASLTPEGRVRVQQAAQDFTVFRDDFANKLVASGVLKTQPTNANYVPHIYPGQTKQEWIRTGPMGSIKEGSPFFTKQRKYTTLEEAMLTGKEPVEKIDDILRFYGSAGYTEMGKRELIDKTVNQFGIKVHNIIQAEKAMANYGPDFGIFAPRGTMSFHKEAYVPKNILKSQGNLIQVDVNDLKMGNMLSKNVPVYILPKSIADNLNRVEKVFGNDEATKGIIGLYDRLLQFWKGRVTVTSPGFHLRNSYSNVANAYLGGLEDFSRYKTAYNIASGKQGTFAGKSYDTILDLAKRHGIYSPTAGHWMKDMFGPEILKPASVQQLVNPLSTRFGLVEGGRKVGSSVENNARLAMFIDRLAKGDTPIQASLHTKKYLFDYSELTSFEQNVMKRTIPFYCVPDDSEALTKEGWKLRKDLKVGELILTYNIEKDLLEWKPIQGLASFEYNQDINVISNGAKKFRCTSEHKWPVHRVYKDTRSLVKFEDLKAGHRLIMSASCEENVGSIFTPEQAALYGWIITDGTWRFRGNHCESRIYQKEKFLDEIEKLVENKGKCVNGVRRYRVTKEKLKPLYEHLKNFDPVSIVLKLDKAASQAMYEAMYMAEGSQTTEKTGNSYFFSQTEKHEKNKKIKEAFQILCTLLGKTTTYTNRGIKIVRGSRYKKVCASEIYTEHYSGVVWCPNTENQTWVMRQEGQIVLTGNTWMRKNLALQAEGVITSPRMAATVGKITGNTYGKNDKLPLEDMPIDSRTPLTINVSGGKAPTIARLDLPIGDLQGDKMGFSPIFSIAKNLYSMAANKDEADKAAPELLQVIHDNLPDVAKETLDIPTIKHKHTGEEVIGMDPRVSNIMTQITPVMSKISRLVPTEGNLADPGYQKRISSFFGGMSISTVDLRHNRALKQLATKAAINNTIKNAEREGTLKPAAVNILRKYFKLQ